MKVNKWIKKNIKNEYNNKVVLITGSNSGIGLSLAMHYASLGANIIMPVRSLERGNKAKDSIVSKYPNVNVKLMQLDLASFESVKAFVKEIIDNQIDFDIFVNNAGMYKTNKGKTIDGLELVMGTNFFGVKLLNDLLFDYIKSMSHHVDVVITTSLTLHMAKINYNDFFMDKKYKKMRAYGNSKYCCFEYFLDYKKRSENTDISVYATHPGATYTPLISKNYKGLFGIMAKHVMKVIFHTPDKAALTILYAVDQNINGAYYAPRGLLHLSGFPKKCKISKKYYKNVERLMKYSDDILNDTQTIKK